VIHFVGVLWMQTLSER